MLVQHHQPGDDGLAGQVDDGGARGRRHCEEAANGGDDGRRAGQWFALARGAPVPSMTRAFTSAITGASVDDERPHRVGKVARWALGRQHADQHQHTQGAAPRRVDGWHAYHLRYWDTVKATTCAP